MMLQRTLAILLLFSISLHSVSRLGTIICFTINQDYIAKVLCVNKAKPESSCKGKCYLAKKLKTQAEQERKNPLSQKQSSEITLFFQPSSVQLPAVTSAVITEVFSFYQRQPGISFLAVIYHPPRA